MAHHHSYVSRGEGESHMEAILVPCAAAAHGISEAQPFERLQSTVMPCPSPEEGLRHSEAVSRATSLSHYGAS